MKTGSSSEAPEATLQVRHRAASNLTLSEKDAYTHPA